MYPAVAKRLGLTASEKLQILILQDPALENLYFKDVQGPIEEQGAGFLWIDWQQGTQGVQDPWLLHIILSIIVKRALWINLVSLCRTWQPSLSS